MGTKYEDPVAALQVIGGIIKNPELLEDAGRYSFRAEDFVSELHKVIFSAIGTIYANGGTNITAKAVDDTLVGYPDAYSVYKASRGNEWFARAESECDIGNFDLYYSRLKKMTLLREYDKIGVDMSWALDPDELDPKKRQAQQQVFDSMTVTEISDEVEYRLEKIRAAYVDNVDNETKQVSDGLEELLLKLQDEPEFGVPLYGPLVNTVTMGARLTKFYLRSAATGVGKTRTMVADACNIGCDEIYDSTLGRWRSNGPALPTLYISTELEISEVQTMCVAFLSDVSESKILGAELMTFEEKERVAHAVHVLQNSEVYIDSICDFGIKDIESSIKKNHREHGVMYVFFDYLMTTIKIISEMTNSSKGMALREDTILFMFAVKLKDLANELGIFILSSTQLNATWKSEPVPDQNMLRGAKSLADKVDVGTVLLDVTEDDLEKIRPILSRQPIVPNVKMSVYKNRRGAYNRIFLWMYADKGTCRYEALFATDYNYRPIILNETSLTVVAEEAPREVVPMPIQEQDEFKNEFDDNEGAIPEPVFLTADIEDDYEF